MTAYYPYLLKTTFIIAPIIFIVLLFVNAPYGKHSKKGWGLLLQNKWAWIIMELPAVLVITILFINGMRSSYLILYLIIWLVHYLYRTFYFPSKMKASKKSFPLLIVLFAILFNCLNGFLNGYYLFHLATDVAIMQIGSTSFYIGLGIFILGFYIHVRSDHIILNLRKTNNDEAYKIPYGFLFRYISNPNYLGEIIQWSGWAILTWSLPGLAFAVFTFCNLAPRAISNHKWYRSKFEDYPKGRKVLIPYII